MQCQQYLSFPIIITITSMVTTTITTTNTRNIFSVCHKGGYWRVQEVNAPKATITTKTTATATAAAAETQTRNISLHTQSMNCVVLLNFVVQLWPTFYIYHHHTTVCLCSYLNYDSVVMFPAWHNCHVHHHQYTTARNINHIPHWWDCYYQSHVWSTFCVHHHHHNNKSIQ